MSVREDRPVQASSVGSDRARAGLDRVCHVYLVWGSTYLGIAILIEPMPPLLASGSRLLLAADHAGRLPGSARARALADQSASAPSRRPIGFLLLAWASAARPSPRRTYRRPRRHLVASMPLWVVMFRALRSSAHPLRPSSGSRGIRRAHRPGPPGDGLAAPSSVIGIVMLGTFCWA